MTVSQLIEMLYEFPRNAEVYIFEKYSNNLESGAPIAEIALAEVNEETGEEIVLLIKYNDAQNN
jgi:hypothetical protein